MHLVLGGGRRVTWHLQREHAIVVAIALARCTTLHGPIEYLDCGVKTPTPKLNMGLLNVPTEILEEVVVLVIQAVGLDEAMKLRLICRKAKPAGLGIPT